MVKDEIEEILKKVGIWFNKDRKMVFFTTIIIGLLVHFEMYSNELLAYDGYWHYGSFLAKGWEVSLGRFFIPITDLFRGTVVVSFLTTIISLVNIAFAAIFINETLKIKKLYIQILVGILLVVTPTFSLTLMYAYTASGYSLAMLFAVLSVYFLEKEKNIKNILTSLVCIVITLSCYQAYLCVITTLLAIVYILKIIDNQKLTVKHIWLDLGIIALGMIIYYICFNIIVKILHLNITDYSEGSSVLSIETLKNILPSIKTTYTTFFNFYFGDTILNNKGWHRNILYIALFVVMIINSIRIVISRKIYKTPSKMLTLILILLIFPICACSIRLITWTREINLLMASSLYLTLLILLKQMEYLELTKINNIINIISFVLVLCTLWSYVLADNATYVATKMYNNQMASVGNRIISKIEENEEITEDMPILILGKLDFSIYNSRLISLTNFDVTELSMWTWQIYMQDNLGIGRKICTFEEDLSMYDNEEYINMPAFPDKDGIKIINNEVVVKLGK